MKCTLVLAAVLGFAGSACAELRPAIPDPGVPMRELVVQSEMIVVSAPAGPIMEGRFRVLRVLSGSGLKEGECFEIDGLATYDLTVPKEEGATERKPVSVAEVLLFLGPPRPDGRWPLTPSGLRILSGDATIYFMKHWQGDGGRFVAPYRSDVRWEDLLQKAAADAGQVNQVRFLKGIADPHRRDEALLDWVERHRREFGAGLKMDDGEEPTYGWGSLEQDVFQWVLESRIPPDCWAAVKLYAELNHGALLWSESPPFGTRAGRQFLLSVAEDDDALAGDRARALRFLASPATLWPVTRFKHRAAGEPLDATEQAALIDRETPLLKDANPRVRAAAAEALLEASSPQDDSLQSFRTQRALSALTEAYREEPPGWTRDALAEAVAVIADPARWRELSGNAHGVVAVLNLGCWRGAEASCEVAAPQAKAEIKEVPTLVLERLDDKRTVVEKKERSLNLDGQDRWAWPTERGADYCEHFEFSMADFPPGLWRMTVKGVSGEDKAPWTSEPRLLRLAPPPSGQPNAYPTEPRVNGAAPFDSYNPTVPRITFDP